MQRLAGTEKQEAGRFFPTVEEQTAGPKTLPPRCLFVLTLRFGGVHFFSCFQW